MDYIDQERAIDMVNGTMTIESMPLTQADRERLRTVLSGEITADEMVQRLIANHRRNTNAGRLRV